MHRLRGLLLRVPGRGSGPRVPRTDGARQAVPLRRRPARPRDPGPSRPHPDRGSLALPPMPSVHRGVSEGCPAERADPGPEGAGHRGAGRDRARQSARGRVQGQHPRPGPHQRDEARPGSPSARWGSSPRSPRGSASGGRNRNCSVPRTPSRARTRSRRSTRRSRTATGRRTSREARLLSGLRRPGVGEGARHGDPLGRAGARHRARVVPELLVLRLRVHGRGERGPQRRAQRAEPRDRREGRPRPPHDLLHLPRHVDPRERPPGRPEGQGACGRGPPTARDRGPGGPRR